MPLCQCSPFRRCLISSAISLDHADALSALYVAPVSLLFNTSAMTWRAFAALNLFVSKGSLYEIVLSTDDG